MSSTLLGLLFCLTPLAIYVVSLRFAYRWGRYGPPVEIKRRRRVDRRAPAAEAEAEADSPAVEIYRYDSPPSN